MDPIEQELLLLADDPKYVSTVPGEFIPYLHTWGATKDFNNAAWQLFRKVRRRVTAYEVQEFINQGKPQPYVEPK